MSKDNNSYFVDSLEDWRTKWKMAQANNFEAKPGYVKHSHIRHPVTTDFASLTEDQRRIMGQENFHYLVIQEQRLAIDRYLKGEIWTEAGCPRAPVRKR